ncbi:sugar phosphate isomerase/epimerase [Paenibacillus sp. MWE-103]|uniref:Sugar phosphate isomerase/epimerase n=1 Tax=Paenibacillus artemisiicola TaxID=1172618 RepID=A0ABS3WK81_9BACL|nr:sugar phosphate isomerase/epimerase family protein [Paenibacillus artemisiicola]MBO7748695.1 sugar phosphate isomerase/epimerase [Paenibacillus artemisiicola]
MKLGIIADPKAESFDYAAGLGLEFVEFCINVGVPAEEFAVKVPELKAASARAGVAVGSIGRWGADRIAKDGSIVEEELQASYTLIDACQELGCPVFVCGANYVEELSYYENVRAAIAYFEKLLDYGRERGVRIATYNCHWNSFIVDETAWKLIHGHLPELGIKYDPSHARYAGQDYLKEMADWGHRFLHVHVKGSVIVNGKRFDDPPAGLDQTDWGTFMAILYGVGYQGGLSIEPHSRTWTGELGDKGVKFTVDYVNRLLLRG